MRDEPIPPVMPPDAPGPGVGFLYRAAGQCAWPLTAKADAFMRCCGRKTAGRGPYCARHLARAFECQQVASL